MTKFRIKYRRVILKIPNWFFNISIFVLSICAIIAFTNLDFAKNIEILDISAYINTVENFCPTIFEIMDKSVFKIAICVILPILIFLRFSKIILKPKSIVIRHSTFSNNQSTYDKDIVANTRVIHKDINLVKEMNNGDIVKAIRTQDRIINEINLACDEFTQVYYYGIAHIPLIFRAGFQIGNEGAVRLLHKFRKGNPNFIEIPDCSHGNTITLQERFTDFRTLKREMLVVVATSLEVTNDDLRNLSLNAKIKCRLDFYAEDRRMYDFDAINSYDTMNNLRKKIMNKIREKVKSENIEKIHLVLATSSDFAFYLAQDFSKYHDPDIIVYQYVKNSVEKYPWGISCNSSPENAVVWNKTKH